MKVLFLSDGEMSVWVEGAVRTLHSERMEKYMATARELENRNAWKYEGAGALYQGREHPYEPHRRMAESSCRVPAATECGGKLLYALATPVMGGLYLKDLDDDRAPESNWLSERAFHLSDMHLQGETLAMALNMAHGECHIALLPVGKARYEVVTQGATQDTAPFLCDDGRTLYYVSAGYARNEDGFILARGPSALLRLDVHSGDLTEVCAEDDTDYLRPKVGPDGLLYFIRRPWKEPAQKRLTLGDKIKNVGAFFKGVGRMFQFIGDPEGSAKRKPRIAGQKDDGQQKRMLEGVLVDVTRMSDATTADDEHGCVPDAWVLMRREPDGSLTELMKGVADYDFDGDALVYSDGRRIVRLQDGKKTVLHKAVFIPRIVVCK